MRVLCSSALEDLEGEVIGGELIDPDNRIYDLEGIFKIRCDDGAMFNVMGWAVEVTVLVPSARPDLL